MLNSHSRFIEEDAIRLLRNDPSKVDLWRSFEGQQGARMTEKEKKTDFTASPAAEFSASSSLFFFSLCRELFLLLFPVTSARYLETPRSFDHKRHRCKVAETVSIVTDPYHRCAHFQCINHVPKVSEQKRGTSKHRDSLVGSKRSKEIERERAYCSPWDSRLFERR